LKARGGRDSADGTLQKARVGGAPVTGTSRASPLVSVVIPAWNAEATVLDTVRSVLRQTFSAFELIVIDDGSTDATVELLRRVDDPRVRVHRCPNAGLPAARNRGIERSTGEFVSFIDADDEWTPDKLELQLRALRESPGAGLAYSWTAFIDRRGDFLFAKERSRSEGDVYEDLVRHCFLASGSNALVRRSCLEEVGGFDTTLAAAQDWDLYLRIAARWPFALVPRYQVLYRLTDDTMSGNAARCEAACLTVLERALGRMGNAPARLRSESLSNLEQYVAFLYLSRAPGPDAHPRAGAKLARCVTTCPRTLLTRKTLNLLATWLLLHLLPARRRRAAVTSLLRWHGRLTALLRPDVRELADVRHRERLPGPQLSGGRASRDPSALTPSSV
jgi:glycosyltransferase involved in cell wall biosynthesis